MSLTAGIRQPVGNRGIDLGRGFIKQLTEQVQEKMVESEGMLRFPNQVIPRQLEPSQLGMGETEALRNGPLMPEKDGPTLKVPLLKLIQFFLRHHQIILNHGLSGGRAKPVAVAGTNKIRIPFLNGDRLPIHLMRSPAFQGPEKLSEVMPVIGKRTPGGNMGFMQAVPFMGTGSRVLPLKYLHIKYSQKYVMIREDTTKKKNYSFCMMKNHLSCITANYVAKELNYHMTDGWSQGNTATQEAFKSLETFEAKFTELAEAVRELGFSYLDIWIAHLHPCWATDEHVAIACDVLKQNQLTPLSLAGGFGSTLEQLEGFCRLASSVGAGILAGGMPVWHSDRAGCIRLLRQYGIKWAFENHPNEKTAEDVIAIIGEEDMDIVGVACDTGWFGTNDCDANEALRKLAPRLMHLHLKDVREAGQHRTCQLGDGVVGIEACVETLREIGYQGPIGIEHEPEEYDPTEEVRESLRLLKSWMSE